MRRFSVLLTILLSLQGYASVLVENATVRLPLPGKTVSAGYFSLYNQNSAVLRLIKVESPQFGLIELHQHIMRDGMMQMLPMSFVEIQPGEHVHFQPGGLHLMLFRPKSRLTLTDQVQLTLFWSDQSSQQVVASVTKIPIN